MDNITVGIVGCGFVGGALKRWLEENNPSVNILVLDPFKGYNDDVGQADVVFVSIHVPTEDDGTQELKLLKEVLLEIPARKPIFIRTTILPGTSSRLSKETGRRVYFLPEFLTERTAFEDFSVQPMVFTAETELLKRVFTGKAFIEMSSLEAEIAKYAHNVFGALKVTYFNGIYDYCTKHEADYANVRNGILLSGYINDVHTQVPGPDGKLGYGGKCFPKDVNSLTKMMEGSHLYNLLAPLKRMNIAYRGCDC